MFGLFGKKKETPKTEIKPKKPKKSVKDQATENGEPYFEMLNFSYDEENPSNGAFEFDWNYIFVQKLRGLGYPGQTDEDVVDNWFTHVCRGIAMENYEKEVAQQTRTVERTELGNGKAEYR